MSEQISEFEVDYNLISEFEQQSSDSEDESVSDAALIIAFEREYSYPNRDTCGACFDRHLFDFGAYCLRVNVRRRELVTSSYLEQADSEEDQLPACYEFKEIVQSVINKTVTYYPDNSFRISHYIQTRSFWGESFVEKPVCLECRSWIRSFVLKWRRSRERR